MSRPLPSPAEVREFFHELLGLAVTVRPTEPVDATDTGHMLVSGYVDSGGRLAAVMGMDVPLTVYAGAAFGDIPLTSPQASVSEGDITPMIAENVTEVCTVLGALLNREGLPHVHMSHASLPGRPAGEDALGLLLADGPGLDVTVELAGYGSGRFSVRLPA